MTYEYECDECKHQWEMQQTIKEDAEKFCPNCKKETAKRLISGKPGFILMGGCWASNGYGR